MSFLKRIKKEGSQPDIMDRLPDLISENEQYIIDCRRTAHRFAEVGGKESKTSAFVRKEAEALGLNVEKVSDTGLLITLDTGQPGNGVALRSELDALPIPENPCNMKGPRSVVSNDPETSHNCGIPFEPEMSFFLPPVINDEEASDFAKGVFERILPEGTIVHADKWFASDSFAEYLTRYKGVYAFLGIRNEAMGTTADLNMKKLKTEQLN